MWRIPNIGYFEDFQHFQREASAVCSLQRNTGRVQPTTEIEPEGLRKWLTRQMKGLNMLFKNISMWRAHRRAVRAKMLLNFVKKHIFMNVQLTSTYNIQ